MSYWTYFYTDSKICRVRPPEYKPTGRLTHSATVYPMRRYATASGSNSDGASRRFTGGVGRRLMSWCAAHRSTTGGLFTKSRNDSTRDHVCSFRLCSAVRVPSTPTAPACAFFWVATLIIGRCYNIQNRHNVIRPKRRCWNVETLWVIHSVTFHHF